MRSPIQRALAAAAILVAIGTSVYVGGNRSARAGAFISYSCAQSRFAAASSAGAANGTSWANAWSLAGINWTTVGNGTATGNSCLFIDGGSSGQSYGSGLTISAAGTDETHRVIVLTGQDAGHNGTVTLSGGVTDAQDYTTIDGEGADATTQRLVLGGDGTFQGASYPVFRFVEISNATIVASDGTNCADFGGIFDHLYLHNIGPGNQNSAMNVNGRNCKDGASEIHSVDTTNHNVIQVENSHIVLDAASTDNGSGSDGVQGTSGIAIHDNVFETLPNNGECTVSCHQDFVQSGGIWESVYNNAFKDGGDSGGLDFDCFNDDVVTHVWFYNNVVIKNRGGAAVRFYSTSGHTCTSYDNVHIDNNTFVDYSCCSGFGTIYFDWRSAVSNPTVASSEIQNNIFYNDTFNDPINIDTSSNFVAANWNVDYNDLSGGTGAIVIEGSAYTQSHPFTCTPSFQGYNADTSPFSTSNTYAALNSDLHLAGGDSCATGVANNLSTVFTTDKDGNARPSAGTNWDLGAYEH